MDAAWEPGSRRTTPPTPTAAAAASVHRQLAPRQGAEVRERIVLTTKTFNPMSEGADDPASRRRGSGASSRQPRAARRRRGRPLSRPRMDAATRSRRRRRFDGARAEGIDPRLRRQQRRRRVARGGAPTDRHGPPLGAELALAARAGRRDATSSRSCARGGPRLHAVQPARRRLADREVPARRGAARGLADDAAARALPAPRRTAACSTRSRRSRRSARERGVDIGRRWRSRGCSRHPHVDGRRRRPAPPRAAPARARGARARPRRRPSTSSSRRCSHERARPRRAAGPVAADDGRAASRRWRRCSARSRAASCTSRCAPVDAAGGLRQMLMGLMPAYRGGERPAWSLKEIVIAPGNPAARAGRAPGRGPAPRRRDGRAARAPERVGDHRDPHGGRVGGRDARARARRGRAWSRSSAAASRRAPTSRRCAAGCARGDPDLEPHAEHAQALRGRDGGTTASAGRARLRGADVVCTCTSAREPVAAPRVARPGRARERGRLEHPDARELDTETIAAATLFVDRRESALNEAGAPAPLAGRDRRRAHRRRARRGARRRRTRAHATTRS